jgi:hypothetical protein
MLHILSLLSSPACPEHLAGTRLGENEKSKGKYIYYAEGGGGGGGMKMSWKKLIILQGPCWGSLRNADRISLPRDETQSANPRQNSISPIRNSLQKMVR